MDWQSVELQFQKSRSVCPQGTQWGKLIELQSVVGFRETILVGSVILAIAIIVGLIWWTQRRRGSRGWRFGRGRSAPAANTVPRRLRKELIRIAGNAQVAERLVNNLRHKHPGQSESWYWEKAIFDLERDRHY